jgi:sialic acid synthase SpsE
LVSGQVVVTAEIGINHNGDKKLAEDMIDAAAECGVDAVKFQAFKTPWMYSKLTPGLAHTESDVFAQMQRLEVKDDWWDSLKERSHKKGLLFSASVFDMPSLEIIEKTGIDFIKIASSELNNHAFLAEHKRLGDTFVVSTGMAVLEEVSTTVRFLESIGINKMILLECTSSYPAPPESVRLLNIDFLAETFDKPAGFSDHTLGIHYPIAAAARGARFIEKHFTLDKNMDGPDQKISADPGEMKQLVEAVRQIGVSLNTNRKSAYSPHEQSSRDIGRKSVIALKKIKKGEVISLENTVIKRPAKGVSPDNACFLYGRTAKQDIEPDQWITWEMV